MSPEETSCPKCDGNMVQGFIVDNAHMGARMVAHWVEGSPEKSFWLGTKVPADLCFPVGTFRCEKCGFLESYARPEFATK